MKYKTPNELFSELTNTKKNKIPENMSPYIYHFINSLMSNDVINMFLDTEHLQKEVPELLDSAKYDENTIYNLILDNCIKNIIPDAIQLLNKPVMVPEFVSHSHLTLDELKGNSYNAPFMQLKHYWVQQYLTEDDRNRKAKLNQSLREHKLESHVGHYHLSLLDSIENLVRLIKYSELPHVPENEWSTPDSPEKTERNRVNIMSHVGTIMQRFILLKKSIKENVDYSFKDIISSEVLSDKNSPKF